MCRLGSENTRPTGGRQEHAPNPTCPQASAARKGLTGEARAASNHIANIVAICAQSMQKEALTKENEAKENEALMKEHEASVKEKRH